MKMQMNLWFVIVLSVGISFFTMGFETPTISHVEMTQSFESPLVTITYQLEGAPGIVTLDIQTNGVSIGEEHIQFLAGDVNKEVKTDGSHTIQWSPDKSWPGHKVGQATAKVCVWNRSSPPNYMAVELVPPYQVNWYTSTNALPEGIGSERYRKNILLMRRICQPNSGTWVMGSPTGETGRSSSLETLHRVALTNDYWMGVFEVTQWQWEVITGYRISYFRGDNWACRPVEQVKYDQIRGSNYPENPAAGSFLTEIRNKTGLQTFDLPSEMQWEYACRAGTDTALNSGASMNNPWHKEQELDKLGRYRDNGGQKETEKGHWDTDQATAPVGSYLPNAWGLYDMHGNIWEWCLDWFTEDITELNGNVNRVVAEKRVRRGGGWHSAATTCRSACREASASSVANYGYGFRLVCFEGLER